MNSDNEDTIDQAIADDTHPAADKPAGRGKRDFPLGRVVMTTSALEQIHPDDCLESLARHAWGDWGDLDEEDREMNERSLQLGGRLLSAYSDRNGRRFWIITEADRSATTILLPEDY